MNDSQTVTTSNKEALLKLYKIILLHLLLCECENGTLLKQHERRTAAAEMILLVSVVGYTLFDHYKNGRIRKEINDVYCTCKWTQHLLGMNNTCIPTMDTHLN
jgi:hypothetical protein